MRTIPNEFGFSVMVTNEEYVLVQKIKARGIVPIESIKPYYQEMADKLVSRGVLNKELDEEKDEEFYTPVKRSST